MTEAESHLLNALVTEYLTREAPDTAREFQSLLNSPSPVTSCSFRLEDAVQHFLRTAPSKGNQLGLKDGLANRKRRRKREKVERPSSGEEKVLKVDQFILSRVSIFLLTSTSLGRYSGQI